jgi:hypothetical protein
VQGIILVPVSVDVWVAARDEEEAKVAAVQLLEARNDVDLDIMLEKAMTNSRGAIEARKPFVPRHVELKKEKIGKYRYFRSAKVGGVIWKIPSHLGQWTEGLWTSNPPDKEEGYYWRWSNYALKDIAEKNEELTDFVDPELESGFEHPFPPVYGTPETT